MPVHYAPRTPSFRVDSSDEIGGMGNCENMAVVVIGDHDSVFLSGSGRGLCCRRRGRRRVSSTTSCTSATCSACASIVVLMPPDLPEWRAVRDRLLRATRPMVAME